MLTGTKITYTHEFLKAHNLQPCSGTVGLTMRGICVVKWSSGRVSTELISNLKKVKI